MPITWKIDPAHSEVQFKVKHLMITTVTGSFQKFEGEIVTDTEDFTTTTSIRFSADVSSINTNNEQRDQHLKSEEFFHADKYNELSFTGTRYSTLKNDANVQGNLTIRGVTRPVTLDVEFGGIVVDPWGQTKAGFTITGKISRKEFGLTWSAVTEAGSVVVSDEIKLQAEVQVVKQAS